MLRWSLALALAGSVLSSPAQEAAPAGADPDERLVILDAMRTELLRSHELRIEEYGPPYFVSYLVTDENQQRLSASNGAIAQERGGRARTGYVEVRCGDHRLDNSRAGAGMSLRFFSWGQQYSPLPIENDAVALRTALWQITDETYKQAVQDLLTRRGEEVMRVEQADRPNDFSPAEAVRQIDPPMDLDLDLDPWKPQLRRLSAIFNEFDWIEASYVVLDATHQTEWYVNTDGTEVIEEAQSWDFYAECQTTAPDDGQPLSHSIFRNRVRVEELPAEEEMAQLIRTMIGELDELRHAPVLDPYTGPALLAPDVTGVLFHEAVGHRLEGERQRDDDNSGQTFAGKIGEAIIPAFISVIDDPTLREFGGVGIRGHYLFDQEGVPAERVELVRGGILQTYLMSRTPNEYVARSNGHGRSDGVSDPEARMGTLIVAASPEEMRTYEELRGRLIEVCREQGRPFGLIVRDIEGGETNTSSWGFQAFAQRPRTVHRVDVETGEETLVRGVEIVGTPLSSINKIILMGGESELFNGYCGSASGMVPQSEIAPWALSTEVEFQRSTTENRRPPLLPPPFAEASPGAVAE